MKVIAAAFPVALAIATLGAGTAGSHESPAHCRDMRPLNIAVAVTPVNVVHSVPYVAQKLGLFAKRCIEPNILSFEGGFASTTIAAIEGGLAIGPVTGAAIANGMAAKQVWVMAPRLPHKYVVAGEITTAGDLRGKRLSAAGGGVGSFNWRVGRDLLAGAGLSVADALFVAESEAAGLPGLLSGEVDAVLLHPEEMFLAQSERSDVHALTSLAATMPDYAFTAYGASDRLIARDRDLLVDAVAALIEANRTIYLERDKVIPIIAKATGKPEAAVEFAWEQNTRNCVWSVNTGFDRARSEWTIQDGVENGAIPAARMPSFEQVTEPSIAEEAVAQLGGPVEISNCTL